MRVEEGHQLTPFPYPHAYKDDEVLRSLLRRLLPDQIRPEVHRDLSRFGEEVQGPIRTLAAHCDSEHPSLTQYDQWGRRIDVLKTSAGWRAIKGVAFEEGVVAIAYERERYQQWARVYMFAKVLMFAADSRMIMCPFAMTDGCARVLELYGTPEMRASILPRLLSRDPNTGFTAGQWMTERPGGSDVSMTETKATPCLIPSPSQSSFGAEEWELDGFKWFSSATDGDVSLALARTGPESKGARSLSLFLVPLRQPLLPSSSSVASTSTHASRLASNLLPASIRSPDANNGIQVHRLKNKIGTWPLPTAELSLSHTRAYRIGPLNEGVKYITPVLNITRVHSAISSLSYLARSLQIARSYAGVRSVAGPGGEASLLSDMPLHTHTLAKVAVLYRALTHLAFGAISLLGRVEHFGSKGAAQDVAMLRMLTPLVKGYVASYAVGGMEECMIALGGQGYMEENGIGRLIRDGLVEKIWEGTPSIMALDLLRACRGGQSGLAFAQWATSLLDKVPPGLSRRATKELETLRAAVALVTLATTPDAAHPLYKLLLGSTFSNTSSAAILARPLFYLLGHTASSLFMLEHAIWASDSSSGESKADADAHIEALVRWIDEGPTGSGLQRAIDDLGRALERKDATAGADALVLYGREGWRGSSGSAKL